MRLIDADVLYEKFKNGERDTEEVKEFNQIGRYLVKHSPTVNLEQHGKWVVHTEHFAPCQRCSACGFEMPVIAGEDVEIALYSYCPKCGARMDAAD